MQVVGWWAPHLFMWPSDLIAEDDKVYLLIVVVGAIGSDYQPAILEGIHLKHGLTSRYFRRDRWYEDAAF